MALMINHVLRNWLNGNGRKLHYVYVPDARLYSYENVILVGTDSASNRIFCACQQHGIYPSYYCDALGIGFPFWADNLDFMKRIECEAIGTIHNCALVMSEFAYLKLGNPWQKDVYVVTKNMHSEALQAGAMNFYRKPGGDIHALYDATLDNDESIYAAIAPSGGLKKLSLEQIIYRYMHGRHIFGQLRRQQATRFLFLATAAVGDNTAVCSMVEEYKRVFGYKRVAVLIVDSLEGIARLFPAIDEVIVCQRLDFICLAYYFILNYASGKGAFDSENVIFTYFMPKDISWNGFHHADHDYLLPLFIKFRDFLGLPTSSAPSKITVPSAGNDLPDIEGNAVLLIPDAVTVYRDSKTDKIEMRAFFAALAKALVAKGCAVYTNIVNENDTVIAGTRPLMCTLTQLVAVCAKFKAIVSVPTGLAELLNLTDCRLLNIWPEGLEWNASAFAAYGGYAQAEHFLLSDKNESVVMEIVQRCCS